MVDFNHGYGGVDMKTKQAALYEKTHKLIDEIAQTMKDNDLLCGNVSKASVIHHSVVAMHKKIVKKGDKNV